MPRIARAVAVDYPHHITHRGNNRQDIFFVDDDRRDEKQMNRIRFGHAYWQTTRHRKNFSVGVSDLYQSDDQERKIKMLIWRTNNGSCPHYSNQTAKKEK